LSFTIDEFNYLEMIGVYCDYAYFCMQIMQ